MAEERSSGIADGIRTGIGMLSAFKEALEETLEEAIARGDLSPERAKGVMRDAAEKVQSSFGGARERFDLVSRKEVESLRREIEALRLRLDRAEGLSTEAGSGETDVAPAAGDVPID